MDVEQLLNLFDSFWFHREIFNKHPFSSNPQNPHPENQNHSPFQISPTREAQPFLRRIPTRSVSEDLSFKLSFLSNSNPSSPDSVLFSPKLQTILSSKEIAGTESPERGNGKTESKKKIRAYRRKRGAESKSLSELEFEELKGFMDLGFVFSEEDKDSSLAAIVPGLNRLRKKEEEEEEETESISRPYLSEAWEAMEKEEEMKKPLMMMKMKMKLRIPGNEIDMKDDLKWWAHAVASNVR